MDAPCTCFEKGHFEWVEPTVQKGGYEDPNNDRLDCYVELKTCKHCGALWLEILSEDMAFSRSSRWVSAWVTAALAESINKSNVMEICEHHIRWHF